MKKTSLILLALYAILILALLVLVVAGAGLYSPIYPIVMRREQSRKP